MDHSKSAKKKKPLGQRENCVLYQFSNPLVQTVLPFGVRNDALKTNFKVFK